jgi:hypothetical protein
MSEKISIRLIYLFSSNSIVNSFLDYINRQNEDFRPKSNDLSIELDNIIQTRTNQWKNLITTIKD